MQGKGTTKDYRISLVLIISFVLERKGDERIDGDGLWSCLSIIIIMEVCRKMGSYMEQSGERGEQWNVRDGFLIYIFLCFLSSLFSVCFFFFAQESGQWKLI